MNNAIVTNYFSHHPDIDVFYFTTDGQAFYTENEANNHARNLGNLGRDPRVETITRDTISQDTSETEEQQQDIAATEKSAAKKAGNRKK